MRSWWLCGVVGVSSDAVAGLFLGRLFPLWHVRFEFALLCSILQQSPLYNAARIKTFQPELPEISGKSGAFSFFFFCEAVGSSFSFRAEGKASSEISEKVAKHFEGKDRIFFASTFVETFFRIPKT